MSTNDSDLLRKIQSLLSKAEGTDNEHEAEAFFAKARELMLRNSIDEMTIRAGLAARGQAEKPVLVDFMFSRSDSNAVGLAHLLNQVSRAFGVRMVKYSNRRGSNLNRPGNGSLTASQWSALVGFASDIEQVKAMYLSLVIQDQRFARSAWKQLLGGGSGESKFRTGHLVGFASRVGERLQEQKGKVETETSSTALVVTKDREVGDALGEFFPHLGHARRHRVDWTGNMAGSVNGNRADIGNARLGTSGRLALGSGR